MAEVNRWDGRDFKALVIRPKLRAPIPRNELIRMAGAKAKRMEGKRNEFYHILWDSYVPELNIYVVVYAPAQELSENPVLGRRRNK